MNDAANLTLRSYLRDNVAPQHPLALELAAAWACVVADVAGDLPARVDGAVLHLADVALPLHELADVIRPSLLGAEGAIRQHVTVALLSARYQKRVTWRRADARNAPDGARIYTGAEALALPECGCTASEPSDEPCPRCMVAEDLAASVAHHDARAERAEAEVARLCSGALQSVVVLVPRLGLFAAIRARKHNGAFELPGGKVNGPTAERPGESTWEAAQREAEEELGVPVTIHPGPVGRYLHVFEGRLWHATAYVGDLCGAHPRGGPEGEATWATRDDLLRGTYGAVVARILADYDAREKAAPRG